MSLYVADRIFNKIHALKLLYGRLPNDKMKDWNVWSRGCGRFLGLARLLIPNFACTP